MIKGKIFTLLLTLLFMIGSSSGIIAISVNASSNVGQQNVATSTNENNYLDELVHEPNIEIVFEKSRLDRLLDNSNSDLVVFYDNNDPITLAAANLFVKLLEYDTDIILVEINSIDELQYSLDLVGRDQVIVEIFHGVTDSFRIGTEYFDWDILEQSISSSDAKNHLLAMCFSALLNKEIDDKYVRGLEGFIDYELGVPLLSLFALQRMYQIDGIDRSVSAVGVQQYFDQNNEDLGFLIMNPQNILGDPKTLHFRAEYLDYIKDIVQNLVYFLTTKFTNLARSVLEPLLNIIPDVLLGPVNLDDEFESLGVMDIALNTISDKITAKLNDILDLSEVTLLKRNISTPIGNITFFIRFKEHRHLENTKFQVIADVIQFGFEYLKKFDTQFMAGPIPINIDLTIQGHLTNEILIEYYGHDPSWDEYATEDQPLNPEMIFTDGGSQEPADINGYVAYIDVEGPYDEITVEAPFGAHNFPRFYRVYGGFSIELEASLGFKIEKILKKAGHIDNRIVKEIMKYGKDFGFENSIAKSSLYIIVTLSNEGLVFSLYGSLELGLEVDFSAKFASILEVSIFGGFKVQFLLSAEIILGAQGAYLSEIRVFWPRIKLSLGIGLKLSIDLIIFKLEKEFDFDLAQFLGMDTIYLPNGILENPGEFGNIYSEGQFTFENSPISLDFRLFGFIDELINIVGGVLSANLVGIGLETLLAGKLEIINGSAIDQTPPIVMFATPNTIDDPSGYWVGQTSTNSDLINVITKLTDTIGNLDDFSIQEINNSGGYISSDLLGPNNEVNILTNESNIIALEGDDARLAIYAFDRHTGDNEDSTVERLTVEAKFPKTKLELGSGFQENYVEYSYAEKIIDLTDGEAEVRLYFTAEINTAQILIQDEDGNIIDRIGRRCEAGIYERWSNVVKSDYIKLVFMEYVQNPNMPSSCTSEDFFEGYDFYTNLTIHYAEVAIEYEAFWDSDDTVGKTQPYGDLVNGALYLNATSVKDGFEGVGPATGIIGWGAYWILEIPLYKFYTEGLISEGWVSFRVTAEDSTGLTSTHSKRYYIRFQEDVYQPSIVSASTNLSPVENGEPNFSLARSGTQWYNIKLTEQEQILSYNTVYGTGSSEYHLHSGINNSSFESSSLWSEHSNVIKTSGSSTYNGYMFGLNKPVNKDEALFSIDMRTTNPFTIYIEVLNDVGIRYLTYIGGSSSSPSNNGNGYVMLPTSHFNLQDGNWSVFQTDLQQDLRKVFPNGNVTSVVAFLIRGNVELDNLMLDDTVYMDAEDGSTLGWSIYDNDPSGASITNIKVEKSQKVDIDLNWNKIGNPIYDGEKLMEQSYQLYLETYNIPDGRYFLSVSVYDNALNGETKHFWLIIDNDAPSSPTNIGMEPLSYSSGMYTFRLTWNPSTDAVGVKEYIVWKDYSEVGVVSSTILDFSFSTPTEFADRYHVFAVDYSGNMAGGYYFDMSATRDLDGDGLNDFEELQLGTDPNDTDSDNDGLTDYYEVSTSTTDPLDSDHDNDGLSDGYEVYTSTTNPKDSDHDNDGLSDGYEVYTSTTNPKDSDHDNDGLSDGYEVNTSKSNPKDTDSDNDGLNDYQEAITYKTNPNKSDTDGDGLSDYIEIYNLGTNPRKADTDGDGYSDSQELLYDTDPLDASSHPGSGGGNEPDPEPTPEPDPEPTPTPRPPRDPSL